MAENLGTGVSYVIDEQGYNHSMVVFQKGKPPLDTELNLLQQIQNVLNQRQLNSIPSGWLSFRELYTSMALTNKFYTQNPVGAIPEYAIVNGTVVYVTNTGTTDTNSNLIDLLSPPSTGNIVNGVYLEMWKALIDPSNDNNKPSPSQVIDAIMDVDAYDSNFGWVVGENGLILGTQNGGQTWYVQAIDTKQRLNGVSFITGGSTNGIGWVVGNGGVIARTSSSGARWTMLQNALTDNLNSIYMVNQLTGWSVGDSGTILKTSNGVTWLPQVSVTTQNLKGVYFYDALTGWAVGDKGVILKTTSGGATWSVLSSPSINNLVSVAFFDLSYGFAVGNNGTILRTSDGGLSWVTQSSGTLLNLTDVSVVPTLDKYEENEVSSQFNGSNKNFTVFNVPITSGNGKGETTNNPSDVQVTVNGTFVLVDSVNGATGQIILNSAPRLGDTVKVYYWFKCSGNTFRVWVTGQTGTVLFSDNMGATWVAQNPNTAYNLNGVSFVDKNKGWVVGDLSVIRHTEDGGTTWAVQQSQVVVREVQRDYYEGNTGTPVYLTDDCIHPDVNIETTKRVQTQYRIRVASGVDPSSYPEAGLGAAGVVGLGPNATGQYPFENMGILTGDYGLWRAKCTGTIDGYCWSVPMFFVNRRNTTEYNAQSNTNGATNPGTSNIRPDLLKATNVIADDILDVRRKVVLPPISDILERNFDMLMSNNFSTKFMRNTFGGDKYGVRLLQTDRVAGIDTDGGEVISGATINPFTIISSESVRKSKIEFVTPGPTVPIPYSLPTVSGLYDTNPIYYSVVYDAPYPYKGKPVPGYFSGLGTNTVIFYFSASTKTRTDGIINYIITGSWISTSSLSLKYIPSTPKLVKNTSNANPSNAFYYQGVLDTVTSNLIEQWDSGIPGYTNSAYVYSGTSSSDTDQQNRASSVIIKFYMKVSSSDISGQNNLYINPNIYPDTDVPYNIYTIHGIKNVTSNFSYKIQNIQVHTTDPSGRYIITSETGFPFIIDTVIEITAAVPAAIGDTKIRNGASTNFTSRIKKVGPFYESFVVNGTVTPKGTQIIIPLSNPPTFTSAGILLGVSTTETSTSLIQTYCIIYDGVVDRMFPVTASGFGTSYLTITLAAQTEITGTAYIQVLLQQADFPNRSVNDGLLINYYYNPYQSVSDLPDTLTLEIITKPSTMYVSNLGVGGGETGYPYTTPVDQIPVTDPVIAEGNFYNLDPIRFPSFRVDNGFAQVPVHIPGSFGQDITLSLPKTDITGRSYYSVVSSEFKFESEALIVGAPRKIFLSAIGMVKSASDGRLIKGEYVLVLFSRHASTDTKNYTGFINGSDSVAAIYRLPNKPTVRI